MSHDGPMEPVIALLGPPGSGKGTQAERLDGFVTLVAGELLRQARRERTELGERAAEYMDRGELVPDELVVAMMREAIERTAGRPIVLDGFPRTVGQAEALGDELENLERDLTAAVLIDVPDEDVAARLASRHQGRSDDRPDVIRNRLDVYHRVTEPVIAYYEDRGLLRRVDGTGDPDAVAAGIRDAIG
jgi:adenylate kinase